RNTKIAGPVGVAVDANRTLYVANQSSASVTKYALADGGNIAPADTIRGPTTGLSAPRAIALAPNGNIFVANFNANSVTVYASTGPENRAPLYTVRAGVSRPVGVAVWNTFLWVLNMGSGDAPPTLVGYKGFGADGAPPYATITSSQIQNPQGLAADCCGWLYV